MTLTWLTIAAVASGGALGSVARFIVATETAMLFPAARYPIATTVVNLVGCFLIGFLIEYGTLRWGETPEWRAFLITGFLGGFTTFSAFGVETVTLLRAGEATLAVVSVAIQVVVGLLAVGGGIAVARLCGSYTP